MNKIFKVGGLFSGVGGLELGFLKNKKYEISWANEFDKYCARTYRTNFNHTFKFSWLITINKGELKWLKSFGKNLKRMTLSSKLDS